LVGLVPAPYQSGETAHDLGITRAGNKHVRRLMVQLAWSWVRYQPESALTGWYHRRFGGGSKRLRRIGIVALARKLLIALWRYVDQGAIPEGAIVKGQGITGTSVVSIENLDPNSNPPPPLDFSPRDLYLPSAASQFTKMLDSIEESLRSFRQVDFAAISSGLTNAISAAGSLVIKLDRLDLHAIVTNANDMIVEVNDAAATLQTTVEDIRTTIKEMGLARLGGDADARHAGGGCLDRRPGHTGEQAAALHGPVDDAGEHEGRSPVSRMGVWCCQARGGGGGGEQENGRLSGGVLCALWAFAGILL